MAISFTDYNGLQPYFAQYRAYAQQYGFPADEGDANLAADDNFRTWVLTGALPLPPPSAAPAPSAATLAVTAAPAASASSSSTSGTAAASSSAPASGGVDYSLVTVSGLDLAGPTGGGMAPGGAGGAGQTSIVVNTAAPAAGGFALSWKWIAAAAIAAWLLRKG